MSSITSSDNIDATSLILDAPLPQNREISNLFTLPTPKTLRTIRSHQEFYQRQHDPPLPPHSYSVTNLPREEEEEESTQESVLYVFI